MEPNSLSTQLALIGLSIVLAVDLAMIWNRVGQWWGWMVRGVAIALCVISALAAAGVSANREINIYANWSDLAGRQPAPVAHGQTKTASRSASGSQIVDFEIAGKASGITLAARAYLPPGYDSPQGERTRYPVVEALDGFPGSPNTWLISLKAGEYLDGEITAGRMAPTVVIFPRQVRDQTHDSECVDAAGGDKFETYLTQDVRSAVTSQFRVRTDRAGWGIIGTSTGGFCAANIALRHPDLFAAAASLSGYFTAITDSTTGDLYKGNQRLRDENSPLWRIKNLPVPDMAMYLATAQDDKTGYAQLQQFVAAVKPPLEVTTEVIVQGGHTGAVWKVVQPSAWDWLSGWLAAPQVGTATGAPAPLPRHGPVTQRLTAHCPKVPAVRPVPGCPAKRG
jgi:enterochelin esterase-like enzyme